MMGQRNDWRGIPPNHQREWDRIFIASQDSLNLSVPCPICKAVALHHWYQVGQPKLQTIAGNTFVATGGLWEWCSSCRSFEHLSALVPEWWTCDLKVDETKLTAKPTAIEEAMKAQGYRLGSELESVKYLSPTQKIDPPVCAKLNFIDQGLPRHCKKR